MAPKIAIVYYSTYGHIRQLVRFAAFIAISQLVFDGSIELCDMHEEPYVHDG
jgi:hypothetical protein